VKKASKATSVKKKPSQFLQKKEQKLFSKSTKKNLCSHRYVEVVVALNLMRRAAEKQEEEVLNL
jgi:hypothetical protein|tara:strand:- start:481 stop:672 length:192 start_codon:yes stop_codon:yes gene_type:complete